ncbi:hypothetical protein D3C72_749210 [compost metagenome]
MESKPRPPTMAASASSKRPWRARSSGWRNSSDRSDSRLPNAWTRAFWVGLSLVSSTSSEKDCSESATRRSKDWA